ncbi:trans-resveratrol di-O-methyltransferase-like [Malania oleifera]|uniref:trans-resveratrol di-O-methyltransferase-like n=1 Tax=Malania oleifera TaxID=397392 RepID=UPI0025AEC582|nr:trans-resveratrol di-O-methyltransferase-like [Malania oleifera]
MDLITQGQGTSELFKAQTHIYNQIFKFIDSMCLRCAVQLGIPDIIHSHNQPMTLSELVSALKIPLGKTRCVHRLMCILMNSGFFATESFNENQEGYVLTSSSRLLLKGGVLNLSPYVLHMLEPVMLTPWNFLGDWFQGNESTAFKFAHGMGMWEYVEQNPKHNEDMDEAMASDSQFLNIAITDCRQVFEGLDSLVDVGGGTGHFAKIISEAFPHLKCTVLDRPSLVAELPATKNLNFVGGDMFQSVPSADAVLIKHVLQNWSDEECVAILKRCREAIPSKDKGGKVIVIDMVIDVENDEHELAETKHLYDMVMMAFLTGKERSEKEWERVFLEAGFSHYKISAIFGVWYFIEVYP